MTYIFRRVVSVGILFTFGNIPQLAAQCLDNLAITTGKTGEGMKEDCKKVISKSQHQEYLNNVHQEFKGNDERMNSKNAQLMVTNFLNFESYKNSNPKGLDANICNKIDPVYRFILRTTSDSCFTPYYDVYVPKHLGLEPEVEYTRPTRTIFEDFSEVNGEMWQNLLHDSILNNILPTMPVPAYRSVSPYIGEICRKPLNGRISKVNNCEVPLFFCCMPKITYGNAVLDPHTALSRIYPMSDKVMNNLYSTIPENVHSSQSENDTEL